MLYTDSSNLMNDMEFRGRIKVAVLKYADAILIEDPKSLGHNARYRWGQNAMQNPDVAAQSLQPPVVMDAAVQSAGKDIDDGALQGAVEAVVNKMI